MSVIGLGALVRRGLDANDALQKMAIRTHTTAEGLQALALAGQLADVQMKTIGRSSRNLQDALGRAAHSAGLQRDAFSDLGISIRNFQKLKAEQQFGVLLDALRRVADASERARLGNVLLGGSYQRLAPLIEGGSAALQASADKLAAWGLQLNQQQIDASAAANDALTEFGTVMDALLQKTTAEFAPNITRTFQAVTEVIIGAVNAYKNAIALTVELIEKVVALKDAATSLDVGNLSTDTISDALDINQILPGALGAPGLLKDLFSRLTEPRESGQTAPDFGDSEEAPALRETAENTAKTAIEAERTRQLMQQTLGRALP